MRAPDLNDGTLKALLILILLGANIVLAQFHLPERLAHFRHPERSEAQPRDPVEVTVKLSPPDPSTALGMTRSHLADDQSPAND